MEAEIIVDGNKLKINKFVKKIAFEINIGLIRSLRNVPEWTEIEIKIKK